MKQGQSVMLFRTTCVASDGPSITAMVDRARQITYKTFRAKVDRDELKVIESAFGYGKWLRMKDDYAVSFHKSVYKGHPCVYLDHSRIEYIWY